MCGVKKCLEFIKPVESQAGDDKLNETHGDCDEVKVEKKSNVELVSHSKPSVTKPIELDNSIWRKMCSSQQVTEYTQLMGRWQRYFSFKWTKDDAFGKAISGPNSKTEFALPIDFIRDNLESPNCILFKQYAYFASDLEIKVVVNTTPFYCGQLQVSFYYGASLDKYYKDRANVYCASQMPHVIIDASQSSEGVLKIPYRYYKPLMGTFDRSDDSLVLDMGRLRIFVLSPLKMQDGDTRTVDATVFIRFVNPHFHAMKPRKIGKIEAQMMGIKQVVNATSDMLDQLYPDPQRDNPTDIIPPKPIVPWSAHSWCVGDNLPEPTNPLRTQASGQTPHPPGTLPREPEANLSYISKIFGLAFVQRWSVDDVEGILRSIPFSPMLAFGEYGSVTCTNSTSRDCAVLPPVSVISQLFAYWRGSIEYRLDIIKTKYHTGRLIIAYIPRYIEDWDPTIEDLTHVDHIVIDISDESYQFQYKCNYVADKPWWPRRRDGYYSSETAPPGRIYIGILNRLSAPPNVSKEVNINVYMRAGVDMEFSVPVAPQIGLSFNTDVLATVGRTISYKADYGPPRTSIYVGAWHTTGSGALLRYGPTSDHVTQFTANPAGGYNQVYVADGFDVPNPDGGKPLNYLVVFPSYDGAYAYGAVFESALLASVFSKTIQIVAGVWSYDLDKMHQISKNGDYWLDTKVYRWQKVNVAEAQMDERKDACGVDLKIHPTIFSTDNGRLTFGEKVDSIKPLLRKYAPYCQFISTKKAPSDPSQADFCFPVMPQGLYLDPYDQNHVENKYQNRVRDGAIPILASGFRFYRGSVRFRFIVSAKEKGVFWVQHRPDYNLRDEKVTIPRDDVAESTFQTNYNYLIQSTEINEVIEVEVPFYQPGQLGLLQRPDRSKTEDAVHFSLGYLYCGFDSMKTVGAKDLPYYCQVFYSMGDDMSFSVFQGFPPVFDISSGKRPVMEAQSSQPSTSSQSDDGFFAKQVKKVTGYLANKTQESVTESFREQLISAVAQDQKDAFKEQLQSQGITDIISKWISPDLVRNTGVTQQVAISAISQLVHSLVNPTPKTIIISLATFLLQIGVLLASFVDKFIAVGKKLINLIFRDPKPNVVPSTGEPSTSIEMQPLIPKPSTSKQVYNTTITPKEVSWYDKMKASCTKKSNPVAQAGDSIVDADQKELQEVTAAFVSTCVTGMLAACKVTKRDIPDSLPNFSKWLYQGSFTFTRTANGFFMFFKNNFLMLQKIWHWIVVKFFPKYRLDAEAVFYNDSLLKFVSQVQWCLDETHHMQIRRDPSATNKVYECATIAQLFLLHEAMNKTNRNMPLLMEYCRKIVGLRDKLAIECVAPPVGYEPFVLCLEGPTNVGKSYLAQRLANDAMAAIGFTGYQEITYTRTPGNAYWNQLHNQPVCLFDDFLALEDPNFGLLQIGELFCLKSKAVFNPPMAAIDDKNIRYNPLLVILCCNKPFPVVNGVGSPEAWYRRRDAMYHVQKKEEFMGQHPRNIPCAKEFKHLEFIPYTDPGSTIAGYQPKLTYEYFLADFLKKFKEYSSKELADFAVMLEQAKRFYPTNKDDESLLNADISSYLNTLYIDNTTVEDRDFVEEGRELMEKANFKTEMARTIRHKLSKEKAEALEVERIFSENYKKLTHYLNTNQPANFLEFLRGNCTILTIKTELETYAKDVLKLDLAQYYLSIPFLRFMKQFMKTFKIKGFHHQVLLCIKAVIDIDISEIEHNDVDENLKPILGRDMWIAPPQSVVAQASDSDSESEDDSDTSRNRYLKCNHVCGIKLFCEKYEAKDISLMVNRMGRCYNINLIPNTCVSDMYAVMSCDKGCFVETEEFYRYFMQHITIRYRKGQEIVPMWKKYCDRDCKMISNTTTLATIAEVEAVQAEVDENAAKQRLFKIPKIGTVISAILTGAVLVGSLAVLVKTSKWLFDEITPKPDPIKEKLRNDRAALIQLGHEMLEKESRMSEEEFELENQKGYDAKAVAARNVRPTVVKSVVSQAADSIVDTLTRIVDRNTFTLRVQYMNPNGNLTNRDFRCVGLRQHYALLIDHYVFWIDQHFDENTEIFYIKNQIIYKVNWSDIRKSLKQLENSALCVVELPIQIPSFRNIIKFMISAKETSNMSAGGYLLQKNEENNTLLLKSFDRIVRESGIDVSNDDDSVTVVDHVYKYPYGGRGVCGSVLCTDNNNYNGIIGIHIAGLRDCSVGYAEALVRESFDWIVDNGEPEQDDDNAIIANMQDVDNAIVHLKGVVDVVGTISKKDAWYPAKHSRLIPTICSGLITKPTFEVPVLSPYDDRLEVSFSPLLEGCKHHADPLFYIPKELVQRAYEDIRDVVLANAKPLRMEVGKLSYEQAICGIPTLPDYESVNFNTSEGYPWRIRRPKWATNKMWMFEMQETQNGYKLLSMDKKLFETLEYQDERRRLGFYQTPIFVDSLKDAKLPFEKVLNPGKTRIFSISPIDFSIAQRQYTLDFVVAYQKYWFDLEHSVGIDIYSRQTDSLINDMLTVGNNVVAMDYSKFGDKLYAGCVYYAFKIIIEWYQHYGDNSKENEMVRKCMSYELMYCHHLMINFVYRSLGGMPSGNPLTVILNSLVNCMYIRISWMILLKNPAIPRGWGLVEFHTHVKKRVYGDDLFLFVSDEVKDWFNAITIQETLAKFNISMTAATKGDELLPYVTIGDPNATFLKCRFRRHDRRNVWIAYMDKRVVEEICNWTFSTQKDLLASSIEACEAMLELCYGHGENYYEEVREKIRKFWLDKHVHVKLRTWQEVDCRIYDN
ncbi:hypothetical protein [Hubei picorna-like virus 31]|uniref:hypothetical protein n=1 Tax=Hubei picorna-like virus 31 TaxID=1923111 RepID=UPI00090C0692|nr:hypothetical protein [Hubei picorna-like virus 31]APG77963.1 hypothetical protein [Hubei picorna-like virus 31]